MTDRIDPHPKDDPNIRHRPVSIRLIDQDWDAIGYALENWATNGSVDPVALPSALVMSAIGEIAFSRAAGFDPSELRENVRASRLTWTDTETSVSYSVCTSDRYNSLSADERPADQYAKIFIAARFLWYPTPTVYLIGWYPGQGPPSLPGTAVSNTPLSYGINGATRYHRIQAANLRPIREVPSLPLSDVWGMIR